jgi:hypothetical protein
LYIKDIVEASILGEPGYVLVDWLYTTLFMLFLMEIILGSFCTFGYYNGFFFWLDIIGTGSLVFDIRFLWGGMDAQGFIVARAGRAARSGTRTTRILRVLRVIRVLKVMRLPKMLLKRHHEQQGSVSNPNKVEKTSNLADQVNQTTNKRLLTYAAILLPARRTCVQEGGGLGGVDAAGDPGNGLLDYAVLGADPDKHARLSLRPSSAPVQQRHSEQNSASVPQES